MPNHPSRNWRRVAREAAMAHNQRWHEVQAADEASPMHALMPVERSRISADIWHAYMAGYEAGRASMQRTTT